MSTACTTTSVLNYLNLGDQVEWILVDVQKKQTKEPDFVKINPNGMVPVLQHKGETIFESGAITMYLGENFVISTKLVGRMHTMAQLRTPITILSE